MATSRKEYAASYTDMRGVDFTSDPSEVSPQRFAYLKNMYKNYRSENGTAIETIPGYRKIHDFYTENRTLHGAFSDFQEDGSLILYLHLDTSLYGLADVTGVEYKGDYRVVGDDTNGKFILKGEDFGNGTGVGTSSSTFFKVGKYVYFINGEDMIRAHYDESARSFTFELIKYGAVDKAYIPTTYKAVPPSGYIQDSEKSYGYEYEQRNLLSDYFYVEFLVQQNEDGKVITEFVSPEKFESIEGIIGIEKNGNTRTIEALKYNTPDDDDGRKIITVTGDALSDLIGLRVKMTSPIKNIKGATVGEGSSKDFILGCTKSCVFDNRVFLSGNPLCPNHIFWCGFDADTGIIEPTYFGILDNMFDGINGHITGIMAVSDTLCVLKDGDRDGNIFFHSAVSTGENLAPKAYSATRGLSNIGCIGSCVNFNDDPVFISRFGLEGIGMLSAGSERIIGHRSSNVDRKLLATDLTDAKLAEFEGYLFLLTVEGELFLADSRQKFRHSTGDTQYEWYYVSKVGAYIGDKKNNESGEITGGDFDPAVLMYATNDTVYFLTAKGGFFAFNFDKREKDGSLATHWYSFAGHKMISGCAFKSDNVKVPYLTKTTIKKSTVLKTKCMPRSRAKIKVRTNRTPYHNIQEISSATFDFGDIDFSDFSFLDGEQTIFVIREKEKKWVEKQYYIYSDEYCKPFGIYNLSFRYHIAGGVKK